MIQPAPPSRPIRTPAHRAARAAEPLLTIAQTAAQLAVSTKTVRRLIERGALRVHRVGRAMRISPEDLRHYLAPCRA